MTREEHLQWCKDRANEYIDTGDTKQALASFLSDMSKHPETENHKALELMMEMIVAGALDDPTELRIFIEDVN